MKKELDSAVVMVHIAGNLLCKRDVRIFIRNILIINSMCLVH